VIKPIVLRQRGHRSGGGVALARALGIRDAHPDSPRRTRHVRFVINWGVSSNPIAWRERGIIYTNTPQAVEKSANKLLTLNTLHASAVPTLEFTTDPAVATEWVEADHKCIARRIVNGHSGQGISVVRINDDDATVNMPHAPLYTRYWKKQKEFRVHVAFGRVLLIQEKRQSTDDRFSNLDRDNRLIRTYANGSIFCINDLHCDVLNYRARIEDIAILACRSIGLAHGAVDIMVKIKKANRGTTEVFEDAVVCETNSAPALESPTAIEAYATAVENEMSRIGVDY